MGAAPAELARFILDANILVSAVIASSRASGSVVDTRCRGAYVPRHAERVNF